MGELADKGVRGEVNVITEIASSGVSCSVPDVRTASTDLER